MARRSFITPDEGLKQLIQKTFDETKKGIVKDNEKLFVQVKNRAKAFQKSYQNYQFENLNRANEVTRITSAFSELLNSDKIYKRYYERKQKQYQSIDKEIVFTQAEQFLEYIREFQGITIRTLVATRTKNGDFQFSVPEFSTTQHIESLYGSIKDNLRMKLNKNQKWEKFSIKANESKYIQAYNQLYKATTRQRDATKGNGPYYYTYNHITYKFRSYGDLTEALVDLLLDSSTMTTDPLESLLIKTKSVTNLSGMLRGDIDWKTSNGKYQGIQVKAGGSETMMLGQVYNLSIVVLTTDIAADLSKKLDSVLDKQISNVAKDICDEANEELDSVINF